MALAFASNYVGKILARKHQNKVVKTAGIKGPVNSSNKNRLTGL